MRTRVKFCGITNRTDLDAAIAAGADAVGFNMYSGSARRVEPGTCAALVASVPAFVTCVGLFVNPEPGEVETILAEVPFDLLQFHGDETAAACAAYGKPYIKAIRVGPDTDLEGNAYNFASARALLLDAAIEGEYGGTGRQFDWGLVGELGKPVILAGGLRPDNVGEAIRTLRPFAVDVSSGIELDRGKKDEALMRAFAAAVRAADGDMK